MEPKYTWDEYSRSFMPREKLAARSAKWREDEQARQAYLFGQAAKRPQELEVLDLPPPAPPPGVIWT